MENHGVNVPWFTGNILAKVTARCPIPNNALSPDQTALERAILSAIVNARSDFLFDESRYFQNRNVYFKSYYMDDGIVYPCLVDYWHYADKKKVAIFLQNDAGVIPVEGEPLSSLWQPWQPTHKVQVEGEEVWKDARLMCGIDDENSELNDSVIDFFYVRCYETRYSTLYKGREVFFSNFEKVFQGKD